MKLTYFCHIPELRHEAIVMCGFFYEVHASSNHDFANQMIQGETSLLNTPGIDMVGFVKISTPIQVTGKADKQAILLKLF